MIVELQNTALAERLFSGWEETMIWSCLQGVMGSILVTDRGKLKSAVANVGCFAFFAGEADEELVRGIPESVAIMVPQNETWAALIEADWPEAKKTVRYAMKKNTRFDRKALRKLANSLPGGYSVRQIDGAMYDLCLKEPFAVDFVSSFGSKENYLERGRGVVVLKDGRIVSGASSYSRYRKGIEIEVDTALEERRKGLAGAACASLIMSCLEEGLYPSWDAQNLTSVHLAEKLGYELSHVYVAYERNGNGSAAR